ncbi:adenosylcobinamide-phosphate synthase CbiB [Ectothiorhodospira marina]|uniref:Cobalamin biosynthesis protein CobD n=1 Tax=Ectothiorhodospira marina TaxID=1396821 RepID=A0A1H7FCW8_9GAMM|nr:adenosylcobinamide-phosphate synthase CbiB [Ectothiorhodospira marina]SEK24013.1 adenosylcobinamide-phosphate synthase [Ectothiorhodospira marina]
MLTFTLILAALLLDRLLGEPRRWHPLVGFGALIDAAERRGYADDRRRGAWLVAGLVIPLVLFSAWLAAPAWGWAVELLLLYLAIGWRSLAEHGRGIGAALVQGDLPQARQRVAFLVSRDTQDIDEQEISKATVESVLENGNDAVFAPIFWFVVAGAPGVVAYRLVNTLDAMWGYRNDRYRHFGWAAARLDDVLNWIPARLTALAYALAAGGLEGTRRAFRCWRRQGTVWKSPNAGPVMAAGAGALGVRLGGAAIYHGRSEARPDLGEGSDARGVDIDRALDLMRRAMGIWLAVLGIGALIVMM